MTRILIIEDNPANRELLIYVLRAFGYEVLIAHDGEQGLDLAHREWPDLILCDIQLPGIDGYEIARRLKGDLTLHDIPLLAVTAPATESDGERVLAAGFADYVTKSMQPEAFLARVEAFLQPEQLRALQPLRPQPRLAAPLMSESASHRTLLVLDNTAANRFLISSAFERMGYTVLSTPDVSQALQLAHQTPPDVILLDIHLARKNGRYFLQLVKKDPQLQHIPFLLVSSSSEPPHDLTELTALGVADVIVRPIDLQELLTKIRVCLGH